MKKYRVLSMFSGAGGMDIGFLQAGFEIVWANDCFKEAIDSYKANIDENIVSGDITQISSDDMPNDIDVVIGGFPCQGFSVANTRRSMEDKRNFLYKELLRVISDKQPKFFMAENVKGLLSMEKGKVIDMIVNDFTKLGYKVNYKVVNAAEYGVPQTRERVIIMGNRIGVDNVFPVKTHFVEGITEENLKDSLLPAITTEQAIGFLSDYRLTNNEFSVDKAAYIKYAKEKGLADPDEFLGWLGVKPADKTLTIRNHIAAENVADTFWGRKYDVNQHDICDYLKYWRDKSGWTTKAVDDHFGYAYTAGHWFRKDNNSGSIPKPEDWWELKKILGFDDKYDKQVTTMVEKDIKFEQSLRITNWDRPSDTITATSPEIHVNRKRRLSARECAIIQTFPLDYVFQGSLNRIYTQIGNAVPVKLGKELALCIKEQLESI